MRTDTARPVRLADYTAPDHRVDEVDLDIQLDATETRVVARLSLRPSGSPGRLVLDRDGGATDRVLVDGRPAVFEASETHLLIPNTPDRPFTLETRTIIAPKDNTALTGLYLSNGIYCTQCEAEGFRRITPYLDRPDVLARFTTRIEAAKANARHLLANGNPVTAADLPGGRHMALWRDPWPKPAYLFALVAGNLDVVRDTFITRSGRVVRLEILVEEGKAHLCGWAMESLKLCMRWDETAFGREYDLDVFMIVAVSDFNMGAMENKGLNVFNDKYILALPDTATDSDYIHIEAIIAHEYFHNWTGNRITCRDWFQLCLKEGLTVFRDQEFTSEVRSRAVKRITDVRNLRAQQFVEDSGPLAHPVRPDIYHEINNFYTATVYEKGAEVIRALKVLIGDAAFARGMDLYFTRCDGTAATVEDFIACFAESSERDLTAFSRWYSQAGTPDVSVTSAYDAEAQRYTLTFHQATPPTPGQPSKAALVIPCAFGLVGANGEDLTLAPVSGPVDRRRGIVTLSEPTTTVVFEGVAERPVPSLFRGLSAPVRVVTDLTDQDLLFLSGHDPDLVNRWQSLMTVMLRHLIAAYRDIGGGASPRAIAAALARTLEDPARDNAFAALALSVPAENEIAREIGRDVDPDRVHVVRKTLRRALAAELGPTLLRVAEDLAMPVAYAPDPVSVGRRSLRNAIIDLLGSTGSAEAISRAARAFEAADNMTDRLGALSVLTHVPGEAREQAFAAYRARHGADALAMDKWLTLQAVSTVPDTLSRVRALMADPAFPMTNPNRLRALVGAFSMSNPMEFARADGAGFDFLAEVVAHLDKRNPQVAARLLTAFRTWRSYEAGRREKARAALERVAAEPNLSPDVGDIVRRALA